MLPVADFRRSTSRYGRTSAGCCFRAVQTPPRDKTSISQNLKVGRDLRQRLRADGCMKSKHYADPIGLFSITVIEAATCRRSGRNNQASKCYIWKPSRNHQGTPSHIPGIGRKRRGRDKVGGLRTGCIGAQQHGSRERELDSAAVCKPSMDDWSMPQPFPLRDLVRAHRMLRKVVNGRQHIVKRIAGEEITRNSDTGP